MLTIPHTIGHQKRLFAYEGDHTTVERFETPIVTESEAVLKPIDINLLSNDDIIEKTRKVEEENKTLRQENILFARYLLRTTSPKIIETFSDYPDVNHIIQETLELMKDHERIRSFLVVTSTTQTKDRTPLWMKRLINPKVQTEIRYISPVDRERFRIAEYELEQMKLDYTRMKSHAQTVIDQLKVDYKGVKADESSQNSLNVSLQRRVDKFTSHVDATGLSDPYLSVPGELFMSRIRQRINSRISFIGVFLVNSEAVQARMDRIDVRMHQLDDILSKISEIDVIALKQSHNTNTEKNEEIRQKTVMEKSYLNKLILTVDDYKRTLQEQEKRLESEGKRLRLLQILFEETLSEMNLVQRENEKVVKENLFLKDRMNDVLRVPTITDYAYVKKELGDLQRQIDLWTQRVETAELLLPQSKHHTKPAGLLPLLKKSATNK